MNGRTAKLIRKSLSYGNGEPQTIIVLDKEKYYADTTAGSKPVSRSVSGSQPFSVASIEAGKPMKKLFKRLVPRNVTILVPSVEVRRNYRTLKNSYLALPRTERPFAKAAMQSTTAS